MRVCFVASEFFAYGLYGGYGKLVRTLAQGLAERGVETFALVPRAPAVGQAKQPDVEVLDGTTVIALERNYLSRVRHRKRYALPDADLYISMDPRFDSWMAMRQNPTKKHVILFGNPVSFSEKWGILSQDPANRAFLKKATTWVQFEGLQVFCRRAVRRADALFAHGRTVAEQAKLLYHLDRAPYFLPNPVRIPDSPIEKAREPTVLFLARWDLQKRPEIFFELARAFTKVRFIAAGAATNPDRDRLLREQYSGLPNVIMPGRIVGTEKDRWLRESWILANTSIQEGMPLAYQEALSYECALLAAIDADNLPSRYGYHITAENYAEGLEYLLQQDRWRELGRAGREYISRVHGFDAAMEANLQAYSAVIKGQPAPAAR